MPEAMQKAYCYILWSEFLVQNCYQEIHKTWTTWHLKIGVGILYDFILLRTTINVNVGLNVFYTDRWDLSHLTLFIFQWIPQRSQDWKRATPLKVPAYGPYMPGIQISEIQVGIRIGVAKSLKDYTKGPIERPGERLSEVAVDWKGAIIKALRSCGKGGRLIILMGRDSYLWAPYRFRWVNEASASRARW